MDKETAINKWKEFSLKKYSRRSYKQFQEKVFEMQDNFLLLRLNSKVIICFVKPSVIGETFEISNTEFYKMKHEYLNNGVNN